MLLAFVLMGVIYTSTHYSQPISNASHQQPPIIQSNDKTNNDAVLMSPHTHLNEGTDHDAVLVSPHTHLKNTESLQELTATHNYSVPLNNITNIPTTSTPTNPTAPMASVLENITMKYDYLTKNCKIDIDGDNVYFKNCGRAPIAQLKRIMSDNTIYDSQVIHMNHDPSGESPIMPLIRHQHNLHNPYNNRRTLPSIATRGAPPPFAFLGNLISQSDKKTFVKLFGRPTWPGSTKFEYYGITNDAHGLTTHLPITTKHNNMIEEHDDITIESLGQTFKLYPITEQLHYNPYSI